MTKQLIKYNVGTKSYLGTLLKAPIEKPKAAVVLLPDWRGQSALAYDHANHLIKLGASVLIADLYGDGFNPDKPEQVGSMVQQLIEKRNQSVQALTACLKQFKNEVPSETPIFLLGFSAGGMIALDYGRSKADDIDGIILCSALLKLARPEMNTHINAPVLILQGTQDKVSPLEIINEVIKEMDDACNDVQFGLYTQTHHAFDNPDVGTDPSARLVYSEKSIQRAWQFITNFLINTCKPDA